MRKLLKVFLLMVVFVSPIIGGNALSFSSNYEHDALSYIVPLVDDDDIKDIH